MHASVTNLNISIPLIEEACRPDDVAKKFGFQDILEIVMRNSLARANSIHGLVHAMLRYTVCRSGLP